MPTRLRGSSDPPTPTDQEIVREARRSAARANSNWREISEAMLVRRAMFLVHADTDELFTPYRGAVFAQGSSNVVFNERLPMWFTVDDAGRRRLPREGQHTGDVERGRRAAGTPRPDDGVSQNALIKLARLVSADALRDIDDGKIPPERYCQRGGLRLLKGDGVPLLVDHDPVRRVGTVHSLLEFDDVTGSWCWAKATVEDPPSWVRTGTRCSYGSYPIHRSEHGWKHASFVSEVSLLSSDHEPVEPSSCVALLERAASPMASLSDGVAGEIHHPPGAVLVRPGVGRVIGVR